MRLHKDISYIIDAHQNYAKKPSKAFRKHDTKTPYWVHPIWCATTILTETDLDEKTRNEGALALLYHDILEDTTKPLPENLEERIKNIVVEMTFESSEQEMQKIWSRAREVKLYKLYDKVSNLLDGSWMNSEKRKTYLEYTSKLSEHAKANYGELNITNIAKSLGVKR